MMPHQVPSFAPLTRCRHGWLWGACQKCVPPHALHPAMSERDVRTEPTEARQILHRCLVHVVDNEIHRVACCHLISWPADSEQSACRPCALGECEVAKKMNMDRP